MAYTNNFYSLEEKLSLRGNPHNSAISKMKSIGNNLHKIINLIEAGFALISAVWFALYYFGKLNYNDEKEESRRKRVEKYGFLLIIVMLILIVSSLYLIILTIT